MYVADETDNLIQQMSVIIGTNSNPQVAGITLAGTNALVRVEGLPDRTYTIERSADLRTWTTVGTRNGPEGLFVVTDSVDQAGTILLYRARR